MMLSVATFGGNTILAMSVRQNPLPATTDGLNIQIPGNSGINIYLILNQLKTIANEKSIISPPLID